MFIELVSAEETFVFQPEAPDGRKYESTFKLRIVPDDVEKQFRKKNTRKTWERGQRVEDFDQHGFLADILHYEIVSWDKVRMNGADADCTKENKLLLPEKWKAEINRQCLGKEAGELLRDDSGDDEGEDAGDGRDADEKKS